MATSKQKLLAFHWRGITAKGSKVKGQTLAFSEQEARLSLAEQRIQILKIKRRSPSSFVQRRNAATAKDITLFSRQIATMLEAGVPLGETLQLLKTGAKKAEMKLIIGNIYRHVEAGSSLANAMKSSSTLFDQFYCDLVSTGEQTGRLEQIFARISVYREKEEATRAKVVKAMIYPSIVTFMALAVTIGMLLFVIPTFKDVFASFNADLPWFTLKVLGLSEFIQDYGLYAGLGLIIVLLIFRASYKRSTAFRLKVSRFSLHIPIIGGVLTKATLARFTRTLATTFSAGIPLLNGLSAAGKTANNLHYQKVIESVHQQTSGGRPLHRSIKETGQFPDMMTQMVMIGEESGSLDDMLNKVAGIYEDEVDNTVDNLGKILEPLIIITLGLLIGSLVIAMYLPMFDLINVLG
ncbi:type II secretion system F family protein [Enterovibrio sp. ZSDZ35]|uniref:Type II secretion system F family protein n=1 Tax=Enterovibrio qingdaonensis TaxID=2899818 RepID=A0ABT5QMQ8_9GAMM|nr:type II secretion system F family protein [Enterovibrio sp. ZSDZ35]MDD1782276.1 type II secretion system F family protein [Enterovibrio sp. ZSDZ35]